MGMALWVLALLFHDYISHFSNYNFWLQKKIIKVITQWIRWKDLVCSYKFEELDSWLFCSRKSLNFSDPSCTNQIKVIHTLCIFSIDFPCSSLPHTHLLPYLHNFLLNIASGKIKMYVENLFIFLLCVWFGLKIAFHTLSLSLFLSHSRNATRFNLSFARLSSNSLVSFSFLMQPKALNSSFLHMNKNEFSGKVSHSMNFKHDNKTKDEN